MNSISYRFWLLTLLLIVVAIFIISKIVGTDYSSNIPGEKSCPPRTNFDLYSKIKSIDQATFKESFPYKTYVDSADYCDINAIHDDLKLMDSINPDHKENQKILVRALTGALEEKITSTFNRYNPDSLIMILHWANKFNVYKDLDQANTKLYRMVHRHWYNFVANKLGQYHESNTNLQYDYKFKYLVSVCQIQNYPPEIKNSNTSKIIDNLIQNRWSYMFNRFWNGTGFLFKLIPFVIILLTFYGYYCVYKLHFKRNKN